MITILVQNALYIFYVVFFFYPKDFTPGCTTEAAEFARDYKKFKTAGIEIIGIDRKSVV